MVQWWIATVSDLMMAAFLWVEQMPQFNLADPKVSRVIFGTRIKIYRQQCSGLPSVQEIQEIKAVWETLFLLHQDVICLEQGLGLGVRAIPINKRRRGGKSQMASSKMRR